MGRITYVGLIVAAFIPVSVASQVCAKQIHVPEYPPIALAAQWSGVADLTIMIGAQGQVVSVKGHGPRPILIDNAKANVKDWLFCVPNNKRNTEVRLRFDYRLEGTPVYPPPTAKVLIDLGASNVSITSPPMAPQP